jgi:hypothetical protein
MNHAERQLSVLVEDMHRVMKEALQTWRIESERELVEMMKCASAAYLDSMLDTQEQFPATQLSHLVREHCEEIDSLEDEQEKNQRFMSWLSRHIGVT